MSMTVSYKRHRFPPGIIAHAVWLYVRFNLSLREVEEILLKRGIDVSYENDPALGCEIRPADRPKLAPAAGASGGRLASRRSCGDDLGAEILALARG